MMRKSLRIFRARLPIAKGASVRKYFPAWIDSDDHTPVVASSSVVVLPRVRAALPLRQVCVKSDAAAVGSKTKLCDARRVR